MVDPTPPPPPDVVYSAPNAEALDAFARKVCHQMGTDYIEPDVMAGFAAFIQIAADIQVKYLNRQIRGDVDNEE